jgi:hypothetical protein
MYSQDDFDSVVNQLKTKIVDGKITCFKCHFPVGGSGIKQIDMINARITYSCSNQLCDNSRKSGFRSFKALDIVVPSIAAPSDLLETVAPAPPRPEEVQWSSEDGLLPDADVDDDDEGLSSLDNAPDDDDDDDVDDPTTDTHELDDQYHESDE